MGFDFRVKYNAGRLNTAADALSRREEVGDMLFAISQPEVLIFEKSEQRSSSHQFELRAKIAQGEMNSDWVFRDWDLFFKDRVYPTHHWEILSCPGFMIAPMKAFRRPATYSHGFLKTTYQGLCSCLFSLPT